MAYKNGRNIQISDRYFGSWYTAIWTSLQYFIRDVKIFNLIRYITLSVRYDTWSAKYYRSTSQMMYKKMDTSFVQCTCIN